MTSSTVSSKSLAPAQDEACATEPATGASVSMIRDAVTPVRRRAGSRRADVRGGLIARIGCAELAANLLA